MTREDRIREELYKEMTAEVIKLVDDTVRLGDYADDLKRGALVREVEKLVEQAKAIKGGLA